MKSYKGQLVCQHLENISRKALEDYQGIIKEFVKGRHGVYALYRKDHLNYVGLASNLRNRLKTHLKDRHAKTWDTFSVYLTIQDSHLHELETLILKIAAPKNNRQSGKFINSEDIKPLFKRKVSHAQQIELDYLLGKKTKKVAKKKVILKVDGRRPVLAAYVNSRFEIRLKYKGKLYKAIVRKDGSILYKGVTYTSPSFAGYAIKKRSTNGWLNWTYERAPGDWVLLDELRKK